MWGLRASLCLNATRPAMFEPAYYPFMRIVLLVLLALVALLGTAWVLSSPAQTLQTVVQAIDTRNTAILLQQTDLAAVQASLSTQYAQYLMRKMKGSPEWEADQQGEAVSPLAEQLAARVVAEAITPENLLQLLEGDTQVLMGNLNADAVPRRTLYTPLTQRTTVAAQGYDSPWHYTHQLTDTATHRPMMTLHLRFTGLGWQLAGIQVPMWGTLYPY
jgi:hypothetical protein